MSNVHIHGEIESALLVSVHLALSSTRHIKIRVAATNHPQVLLVEVLCWGMRAPSQNLGQGRRSIPWLFFQFKGNLSHKSVTLVAPTRESA